MGIQVDVEMIRQHRLGLLDEATEIARSAGLDRPLAGDVSAITAAKLERIEERAQRLSGLMRELADALDRWLDCARATDGEVGVGLDLLTSGGLAL